MMNVVLIFENITEAHEGWNYLITECIEQKVMEKYSMGSHKINVNIDGNPYSILCVSHISTNMIEVTSNSIGCRFVNSNMYNNPEYLYRLVNEIIEENENG